MLSCPWCNRHYRLDAAFKLSPTSAPADAPKAGASSGRMAAALARAKAAKTEAKIAPATPAAKPAPAARKAEPAPDKPKPAAKPKAEAHAKPAAAPKISAQAEPKPAPKPVSKPVALDDDEESDDPGGETQPVSTADLERMKEEVEAATPSKRSKKKKKKKKKKPAAEASDGDGSAADGGGTKPVETAEEVEASVHAAMLDELVEIGAPKPGGPSESSYSLEGDEVDFDSNTRKLKARDAAVLAQTIAPSKPLGAAPDASRKGRTTKFSDEPMPPPPINLEKVMFWVFVAAVPVSAIAFGIYLWWQVQTGERELQVYHILGIRIDGGNPWVWIGGVLGGGLSFFLAWVAYTYFFVYRGKKNGAKGKDESTRAAKPVAAAKPAAPKRRKDADEADDDEDDEDDAEDGKKPRRSHRFKASS